MNSCSTLQTIPADQRKTIYWKNLDIHQKRSLENIFLSTGVNLRIAFHEDPYDTSMTNFISLASYKDINKFPKARFVGVLHSKCCIHIVTRKETKIQKLADLRGKQICCGEPNSITSIDATNVLLSEQEVTGDNIFCKNCSLEDQPQKLLSEEIDAFFVTAEIPCASVSEVAKSYDWSLIPIPKDNFLRMQKISSMVYDQGEIDLYDYTQRSEDKDKSVETLCRLNLVASLGETDDEIVYQVTRALYKELPGPYKEFLVNNWPLIKSYQISQLPQPLHSASEKFYDEEIKRAHLAKKPKPWYENEKVFAVALSVLIAAGIATQSDGEGGGGCFIGTMSMGKV